MNALGFRLAEVVANLYVPIASHVSCRASVFRLSWLQRYRCHYLSVIVGQQNEILRDRRKFWRCHQKMFGEKHSR